MNIAKFGLSTVMALVLAVASYGASSVTATRTWVQKLAETNTLVRAAADATTKANTAKSDAIAAAAADATTKANTAKSEAIAAAATDATTKANNAKTAAITAAEAAADTKVSTASESAYANAIYTLVDCTGQSNITLSEHKTHYVPLTSSTKFTIPARDASSNRARFFMVYAKATATVTPQFTLPSSVRVFTDGNADSDFKFDAGDYLVNFLEIKENVFIMQKFMMEEL